MEIVDHLERGIINLLDDSMADKGELQVYENSKFKGLFFLSISHFLWSIIFEEGAQKSLFYDHLAFLDHDP